jgi:hypothetical protein
MASNPEDREFLQTEDASLVKDTYTGALLSTDINKLKQHKIRRNQFARSKVAENEINSMKSDITNLKTDIEEVKELLHTIVSKL